VKPAPEGADSETLSFTITTEDREHYKRLDHWLVNKVPFLSRTTLKRLFELQAITAEPTLKLELKKMPPPETLITIDVPPPIDTDLKAQNIPLDILFEDEHLIVLQKPAGLCVHPAPGHPDHTLVNALLYHCQDLKGVGGEKRPGIVHRLDLGTSGVMVVAKDQKTHEGLVELFSRHDIERLYLAVTMGELATQQKTIETLYGRHPHHRLKMSSQVKSGKTASSTFNKISHRDGLTLISCRLKTGRTHQIRVHAAEQLKTPLLGDSLYADPEQQRKRLTPEAQNILGDYPHPLLHAAVLGFIHPLTHMPLRFTASPPQPFSDFLADFFPQSVTL
jgi:23S rRNA pseudouridine1911/1915/1917 synthase